MKTRTRKRQDVPNAEHTRLSTLREFVAALEGKVELVVTLGKKERVPIALRRALDAAALAAARGPKRPAVARDQIPAAASAEA